MAEVSWRERLARFHVFQKVDLPTLRIAGWVLTVPPLIAVASILLLVEPEKQISAVRIWVVGAAAWYCIGGTAVFSMILYRRLEARHLALRRFVNDLRNYAVSNIEVLRESGDIPTEAETESPPADAEGVLDDDIEALKGKERDTWATIIGVLCKDADIDCTRHAAAAATILRMAELQGVRISETAIENKIKLVPDAIAKRMV